MQQNRKSQFHVTTIYQLPSTAQLACMVLITKYHHLKMYRGLNAAYFSTRTWRAGKMLTFVTLKLAVYGAIPIL
jgi:hypothetical protein